MKFTISYKKNERNTKLTEKSILFNKHILWTLRRETASFLVLVSVSDGGTCNTADKARLDVFPTVMKILLRTFQNHQSKFDSLEKKTTRKI